MLFRGGGGKRAGGAEGDKTPDTPDPPTKKTAEESSSFGDYAGRTMEGTSKILTIGALVFTGIYFLPPLLTKQMASLFFPCVPEEYQPLASGACSCSCCICIVVIVIVILMNMAT
jgi:hypothetical protein